MHRFFKALGFLLILAVVFEIGVLVGRGNIRINGLSYRPTQQSSGAFDYSSVNNVYKVLKQNFDGNLDNNKLLDGIKSGMVSATGDPYTEYFNPKEARDFDNQLSGSFTGIGAELGANEDGNIVVVSPLAGYPAEKAGLKPKDRVIAVDGKSTDGQNVSQVVRKIRGPANTKVTLTLLRDDGKPFDVTITRTKISIPSVKYSVEDSIGYIKISQFTKDTQSLVEKAAAQFKNKKVKGIVLDLRGNPGGYLDSAVTVSSLWLDSGKTVVSERQGTTVLGTKYSSGTHPFKGIPTVVLVDGGSASASEITAGALKDNKAATLIGTKTFGKGSVQTVENLPDGAELKVTIARWYTPAGKNIDKQGITPDVVIKVTDADLKASRDVQKNKALQVLRDQI